MTISASLASGILRTEIQRNKYLIYKFWVETTQNWSRKIVNKAGVKTATRF